MEMSNLWDRKCDRFTSAAAQQKDEVGAYVQRGVKGDMEWFTTAR